MNRIKNFFYDKNDIIVAFLILAAAAFIIYLRIGDIMSYPDTLLQSTAAQQTTQQTTTSAPASSSPPRQERVRQQLLPLEQHLRLHRRPHRQLLPQRLRRHRRHQQLNSILHPVIKTPAEQLFFPGALSAVRSWSLPTLELSASVFDMFFYLSLKSFLSF